MRIRLSLIPLVAALFLGACNAAPSRQTATDPSNAVADAVVTTSVPLRISTRQGEKIFSVELAVTQQQQEHGLMGRPPLPRGRGMLFPFPLPHIASFWMKDTPSPLDLVFIRPDGTVAAVLPGKPNDLTPISAGEPVSAVLEIAAGETSRLTIAGGDHVQWGDCADHPTQPGTPINPYAFCPTH